MYYLRLYLTGGLGCLSRCGCCRWSSSHEFLLCYWRVEEGRHRGLTEAPAALMGVLLIVFDQPDVEIGLQLVDRQIDLLAERNPVELVQDSAMEALKMPLVCGLLVMVRL